MSAKFPRGEQDLFLARSLQGSTSFFEIDDKLFTN